MSNSNTDTNNPDKHSDEYEKSATKKQEEIDAAKKLSHLGIQSIGRDDFSVWQAVGGIRGILESILPGTIFVFAFVITRNLGITISISAAIAIIFVAARLISGQTTKSAIIGVISLPICLGWAWFSHDAKNYYLPGFITNGVSIFVLFLTLCFKTPLIGMLVEIVRTPITHGFREWLKRWRSNHSLVRAYTITTWLWILAFSLRLIVQVPLYLANNVVGLGIARLVMSVPLFALFIWLSWIIIFPQIRRIDEYNNNYEENHSSINS